MALLFVDDTLQMGASVEARSSVDATGNQGPTISQSNLQGYAEGYVECFGKKDELPKTQNPTDNLQDTAQNIVDSVNVNHEIPLGLEDLLLQARVDPSQLKNGMFLQALSLQLANNTAEQIRLLTLIAPNKFTLNNRWILSDIIAMTGKSSLEVLLKILPSAQRSNQLEVILDVLISHQSQLSDTERLAVHQHLSRLIKAGNDVNIAYRAMEFMHSLQPTGFQNLLETFLKDDSISGELREAIEDELAALSA